MIIVTVVRLKGFTIVDYDFCGGRRGQYISYGENIQTALQESFSRTARKAHQLLFSTTNIKMTLVRRMFSDLPVID